MTSAIKKVRVIFSVTNCICYDQRVLKMAGVADSLGAEVVITGRYRKDCCDKAEIQFPIKRFRMLFSKGFLFYAFYNIRLFFFLIFRSADLLVSNDLDTLLPNYLVSLIRKIPLAYDCHEYFTGVPELQERPFIRGVWKSIEKRIFPRLRNILTVSDSVAEQYYREYGLPLLTVRNCSYSSDSIMPFTRKQLDIDEKDLLLILQGTGINIDRGGKELIEAMQVLENVSLIVAGSGDMIPALRKMVASMGIEKKVRFVSRLPWKEMMRYTRSADVGLSLDKPTNLNYRLSLPNKLFDYISAGIPVIAANLTEVTNIVSDNKCGIIIPEVTPSEIARAARLLADNRDLLNVLRENARIASSELRWEKESEKVKELYSGILKING